MKYLDDQTSEGREAVKCAPRRFSGSALPNRVAPLSTE